MVDTTTTNVSNYIAEMGIKITKIARETDISDGILRRSLAAKERDLRADELMRICSFLGKNPFDFWPGSKAG